MDLPQSPPPMPPPPMPEPGVYNVNYELYYCSPANYSFWYCFRFSFLACCAFLTWIACVVQVVRIIYGTKTRWSTQLSVLYIATLETFLCTLRWTAVKSVVMDYFMAYLKVGVYCTVCYNFIVYSMRIMQREDLVKKVVWPIFALIFVALTTLVITSSVGKLDVGALACKAPSWMILAAFEFIITFLFMLCGWYITRRLNQMSVSEKYRGKQKIQLWTLIVVNFFTSAVSLAYEIYNYMTVQTTQQCDSFLRTGLFENGLYILLRMIDLLVPVWAVLIVFRDITTRPRDPAPTKIARPGLTYDPESSAHARINSLPRGQLRGQLPTNASFEDDGDTSTPLFASPSTPYSTYGLGTPQY